MEMRRCGFSWPSFAVTFAVFAAVSAAVVAAPRQFTADLVKPREIRITRFDDAIAHFLDADTGEQARFAQIAIDMMAVAYEAELERPDLNADAKRDDDWSWHSGTRRYIERLRRIAAAIRPGTAVQMIKESHGAVRLVVDTEQVMLSAPRLDEQPAFERAIAQEVCRYSYCSESGTTVEQRVVERSAGLDSGWVFDHKAPPTYSSSDGLQCSFDDRRHLRLKKSACINLVHEIRLLTEAIVALRSHGKTIDWRRLSIDHLGAGKPQKVTYGGNGNFMHMHLPGLLRAEGVWRSAIPWIRASSSGRVTQHVIRLPDGLVYLTSAFEG